MTYEMKFGNYYVQGFMDKCAQTNVNPQALAATAVKPLQSQTPIVNSVPVKVKQDTKMVSGITMPPIGE